MPREGTPTERELRLGFEALAEQHHLLPGEPAQWVEEGPGGFSVTLEHDAFDKLSRAIAATAPPSSNVVDPHHLARSMGAASMAVRSMPMQIVADERDDQRRPAAALEFLCDYAFGVAALMAHICRHLMPGASDFDTFARSLLARDATAVAGWFHTQLGLANPHLHGAVQPRPRLFVATPLTSVTGHEEHMAVMKRAEQIATVAQESGYVVVIPDVTLSPETVATPDLPDALSLAEQVLIAHSDVLACLPSGHDSWGLSRAVALAERSGATVAVCREFNGGMHGENPRADSMSLSRLLSATTLRTTFIEEMTFAEAENKFRAWLPLQRARARAGCARRWRGERHSAQHVQPAREALAQLNYAVFDQLPLKYSRARELLAHPALLAAASGVERDALHAVLGAVIDPLLGADAGTAVTSAAVTSASPGATRRALTGNNIAELLNAMTAHGWDDAEYRRLTVEYLDPATSGTDRHSAPPLGMRGWVELHQETVTDCTCMACV